MLWSIDSCENRVSADQYHMTVPWAQVSTHWGRVFLEVFCWQITSFKWSQAQFYFFQWFIWNILCLILTSNWPRTRKFSQFFTNTGGEDLFLPWSSIGHALCPKFDTWVHVEKDNYFSCQSKQLSRCCINFPHELTCQVLSNQSIKIGREHGQRVTACNSWLNFCVRGQFEIKILIVHTTYFIL